MKVYYFGNPYIKEDNLAVKLCEKLKQELQDKNKGIEFEHIDNTFQLLDKNIENAVLIDVVQNLKKLRIIKIEDLKQDAVHTLHDFDLGFFLKLITKNKNKNKNVKIIGIPQQGDVDVIKKEVKEILHPLHF